MFGYEFYLKLSMRGDSVGFKMILLSFSSISMLNKTFCRSLQKNRYEMADRIRIFIPQIESKQFKYKIL
jgi:hypothetical protein